MPPVSSEKTIRVLALAALYGAAIAIAVAFSPANGFVQPERLNHLISLHR